MTLWSSPHPKESAALSLGQAQKNSEIGKIKELADPGSAMPSSAASFASDGSEDAGFEDGGSIDVDMGEEEVDGDGIQIDCIQTLTEFEPNGEGELRDSNHSPLMSDCKTPIPLPPPPVHIGSGAFGGNQAYGNIQNALPRIMDRPTSPNQSFWGSNNTNESIVLSSRAPGDVGLMNIGNTCFMNSALQCLVHTSPLVEFFVGSNTFERTSTSLAFQLNSLMKHVWFGDKQAIAPHDFKLVLGNRYVQFKDCRQHDCQEFLAVLLDFLHEELKIKPKSDVADSSIASSFVEECMESDKTQVQTNLHADDKTTLALSEKVGLCSTGDVSQSQTVSTQFPVNKRLKLENAPVECDSGSATTTGIEIEVDVKRKSPVSKFEKSGSSSKCTNEANEVQNPTVDLENSKEGSSGQDVEQGESTIQKAQTHWDEYIKENNTVIASTFQGMFKSAVTCSECSFISETYEPFMYLSLPIPRVMEKQINVTFISMRDRSQTKLEVTVHLMGTVTNLVQEVIKQIGNCAWDNYTRFAAVEVFNHRISRVLDEKLQLRNLSTNSRNIYVYELNDNFDENICGDGASTTTDAPPKLEKQNYNIFISSDTVQEDKSSNQLEDDETVEKQSMEDSDGISLMPSYGPVGAPVGGGYYDMDGSLAANGVTSSSDHTLHHSENENFNRVQCNICLEDYPRTEMKRHSGCSCVLCDECLLKSVEHHQSEGTHTPTGSLRCAVCLQVVDSKKEFISLEEPSAFTSPPEFITMSVLFRNEPGTDANNNSSWSPGLFGYPWLIRVPSVLNASELVEYLDSINPAPDVNHRFLSVKSDGKSCGQCVYSARCNGCELPKEGTISLSSSNSILISFVDLPSEKMEQMQPLDMVLQNELSPPWQCNRNEEPTIDIHDCLRTFSETEHLDEHNPWHCPRCDKNQQATKALSICKFPDYLIIYLKRFVFLDQSSNKLNNRLTFPINDLDIRDYVTEGFGAHIGKYNLYSCVCHFGTASAGHYTAFAKNPVSNQWHYFNDSIIEDRAPGDSEYGSAYVLFYEKQGMGCNIPVKCNRPLPDLNSFNSSSFTADTRGSYLPGESTVSAGPGRVDGDFINDMNLQVDSTSSNFTYPHPSSETDLLSLEVDEGVGNDNGQLGDIRDGLGLTEADTGMVTSSTIDEAIMDKDGEYKYNRLSSDDAISTTTQDDQLPSSSAGGADSTSN